MFSRPPPPPSPSILSFRWCQCLFMHSVTMSQKRQMLNCYASYLQMLCCDNHFAMMSDLRKRLAAYYNQLSGVGSV
jgi:hypothetical protein